MAQIKKTNHTKYWQQWGSTGMLTRAGGNVKWDNQPLWKTLWQSLEKLNMHLGYGSVFSILVLIQGKWKPVRTPNCSWRLYLQEPNIPQCFGEKPKMSITRWKEKLCNSCNWIRLSNKREWIIDTCNDINESQNDCAKWKEWHKKSTCCMILFIYNF